MTRSPTRSRRGSSSAVAAVTLVAAAAFSVRAAAQETPPPVDATSEQHRVRELMNRGLWYLRHGNRADASRDLDAALDRIEALYSDSEAARKARSLWYEEGSKNFKGEPYERASAYLYRGILHLLEGQYEDARPLFRGGMLQDAFAEEAQNRCDFGLLLYLYAFASREAGDPEKAEEALAEARKLPARAWYLDWRIPEKTRLLVLAETGRAPRKIPDGTGLSQLKYGRGRAFGDESLTVRCDEGKRKYEPQAREDLYYQASTRGGREVDKIIEGKVVFRKEMAETGEALDKTAGAIEVAAAAAGSTGAALGGGAVQLLSGVASLIAANARPRADTRAWDTLPDRIHAIPVTAPQGCRVLILEYLDQAGAPLPDLRREIAVPEAPAEGKGIPVLFVPSPDS